MTPRLTPLRIALSYAVLGAAWIVASDTVVEWLLADGAAVLAAQTAKGLLYIGATTLLVYLLARGARRSALEEAALLGEGERRFRSVVESAPEAIFVQAGGDFAFVNPACAHLLGADAAEDLIGLPVLERFDPRDRPAIAERIRILREEQRPVEGREEVLITLDGRPVPVEASATPIDFEGRQGALVFLRDVTERRQREAERERLLRAVEQAGDSVVVTDVQGSIKYVNPAFERISGFSREEAIGQNPRIQRSGEQEESYYREMWETILGGDTWHGRLVHRRKNGERYTAEASISPVRDSSGEIVDFVAVQRDVTRELDLENQLLQAQKMESVGRLAGGIAHDFNNMLTVIRGNLELVLASTDPQDPRRQDLEEIGAAAVHSSDLVAQLLGFARKQIIHPDTLDLNETVERRLGMLRRLIGEDLDLRWRPSEELWPVHLDPAQLDQILTNLLVNARDAVEGVGSITIETANVEFDEAYCADHAGFLPGEYVMLAISDSGEGMDKETAARIFEPFFTTKPTDKGTGLGLSTVYGIVKQNEGFINVYSEPGEGSTFRIYLTRKVGKARSARETRSREESARGTETVLVVEDEKQLLKLAVRQIESLGYVVLPASAPTEAVRIAAAHEGEIDLLLTDVVMPGMNGKRLYEELRVSRPELRCLYMSGYTADIIAHRGVLEEGVHFLQKPFTMGELSAQLREALEGSR